MAPLKVPRGRRFLRWGLLLLLVAGLVWLGLRLLPFPEELLVRPPARIVFDRHGEPLRFFLAEDDRWRLPVTLDEVPEELIHALVASEDRWFYRHPGVNPLSILRAAGQNLRARRVVSGASTLTMQVARMMDPAPRTFGVKVREAWRALQLETRSSKGQILELYLNLAPYGGNIEGVGAATYFYFGKTPAQLSLGEMALLVTLPRSPRGYDPQLRPAQALRARDRVLDQLGERGGLSAAAVAEARRQPLPRERRRPPFKAPHYSRLAAQQEPTGTRIQTTLDTRIQALAESQLSRALGTLRQEGIPNGAVVVLDTATGALRALVGSGDFFDASTQGQVNGALARRSPGSTLKPFLYGLALDQGEVLPSSLLLDIPTDFAGYVAENYDGQYRGPVEAQEALARSLNAPAVRLLNRVGLSRFLELLQQAGLSTLDRPASSYGLPLVLGACEVSLLELTGLYAGLARGGRFSPVVWRGEREEERSGQALLSPEATWLVTEILLAVERPDLPDSWSLGRDVPAVAWKTGTSYGHRDAWAVGFSGRYTLGVWVGSFDGKPFRGISGSRHAAPLLFGLFRALEPGGSGLQPSPGLRLGQVEVCALSHDRPGPLCPRRLAVASIPGKSRLSLCRQHRRALADAATGELLPSGCGDRGERQWRQYIAYPPELVAWWRSQGQALPNSPRVARDCTGTPSGPGPRIVSPDSRTPYRLRSGIPLADQRLPLIAEADQAVERLYWYRDGVLVGSGPPSKSLFLSPIPGRHRLVVTDDQGRSVGVNYQVEGSPGLGKGERATLSGVDAE